MKKTFATISLLLLVLATPAFADDVQGIFYNPTLHQFQGQTRANGMVGFQQGTVDGSSSCTGCVGEIQTFAYSGATVTTSSAHTAVDVQSLTVPPGRWLLIGTYTLELDATSSLTTANAVEGSILLTNNSNTVLTTSAAGIVPQANATAASTWSFPTTFVYPISISVATTYKIRVICSQASATAVATVYADGNSQGTGSYITSSNVKAIRLP